MYKFILTIFVSYSYWLCFVLGQEKEDKEDGGRGTGDRGGKQADRRIDIQPAEDEDGKWIAALDMLYLG